MRPPVLCLLSCAALSALAAACDDIPPTGSKLVSGVPPLHDAGNGEDEDASQPLYDAGWAARDASAPIDANMAACSGCVCPPETAFCFAGTTPRASGPEGGAPACSVSTSSPPQVGCNALPAVCSADPTCACIIDTLQPLYACYLNCQDTQDGFLVYCPVP